ncbi:CDP-glycerol glycerophosphotransferase family protein [uncultured Sneathia sp.]|uniref:CDP-glycerol glycerophosphotransferase family protein n=1 Tax=uncultured Sneathia sp. TaxID=278067 RepID=UPI00259131FA|nr:CDP-glycerol glycerophosphotransferase family protein [uncultured Sneathia sp.]
MIKCLFNMLIAYILSPFIPMKKEIWLIGGNKGEMYADNGRAMHEYLLTKDNIEVYWVLDKNAKFRKEFDEKNIRYLIRGSIKSYIYFMKSKVALFSHSISADIVPYLCAVPLISYYHRKCFKVFLNHGTVGLKKRSPMHKRLKKQIDKLLKSYNLNPCDSEFEKSIKVNDWKMPEDSMYVCGYPRYDKLYNRKDTVSTHDILYMPTWRKYDDDGVNEFLNNSKLHEYLKKTNMKLRVYLHQLARDRVKLEVENDSIQILDKNANITDELLNAKVLITDYSSVCYDFFYLGKKVCFYQYDKKKYLDQVGSYVDLDNFFSRSNETVDDLIDDLENGKIKDATEYFKYVDNKNCERLYNMIIKRK